MSARLRTSARGLSFLIDQEGAKSFLYRDCAGLPTIGVGHLLTKAELSSGKILISGEPVKYSDGLTDLQIKNLLAQDLRAAESVIENGVAWTLKQHQFDALASFIFNVGEGAFLSSTLRRVINTGQLERVPEQLRRWIRAGGVIVEGLRLRREREIKLFEGTV